MFRNKKHYKKEKIFLIEKKNIREHFLEKYMLKCCKKWKFWILNYIILEKFLTKIKVDQPRIQDTLKHIFL